MKLLRRAMLIIIAFVTVSSGNPDAKRLYDDLLSNYNKLVRPVMNVTDALSVRIKLKLSQLIDVNLKNQIMTTNLWVEQSWYDYKLKWEPKEYGGVEMLHVPSDHIWRPDIVLYNNADGNFEVTLATKATLNYTGRVEWRPPAIYKSSCEIDVEYFPFDEQTCVMKFGSWTYDGFQVDLRHIDELNGTNVVEVGVDLSEFYTSVEWDILEVPAVRNEKFYTCCDEPYLDITFNITMRRKTLFYTVNLIIPCMGISFLTILVFYLPSDSGEKVSLSISILLSLTVFFLLLAEIIPPTSLVVPLLGKFVLFTMILDTFSICVTVVVLNVHFRSPQTHTMAPWVRTIFINHLPRLLVMRRPLYPLDQMTSCGHHRFMVRTCNGGIEMRDQIPPLPPAVALANFDPSLFLDHHLLDTCDSLTSCKLHGSPPAKRPPSSSAHQYPLHRHGIGGQMADHHLHHHHHHHQHNHQTLNHPVAGVRRLDLMDDLPLPFQMNDDSLASTPPPLSTPPSPLPPLPLSVTTPRRLARPQTLLSNGGIIPLATSGATVASDIADIGLKLSCSGGGAVGGETSTADKCSTSTANANIGAAAAAFAEGDCGNGGQCSIAAAAAAAAAAAGTACTSGQSSTRHRWHACPELHKAMDGVSYIADHTKKEEESTRVKEDWKFVAMVLDRLFLWIFTIAVLVGTAGIILQAPTLYDTRVPIDVKMSEIATTTAKPHIARPVL